MMFLFIFSSVTGAVVINVPKESSEPLDFLPEGVLTKFLGDLIILSFLGEIPIDFFFFLNLISYFCFLRFILP